MPTTDPLDKLVNLRDLGGQSNGDGLRTLAGVVYRSDAPHPGDRDPVDLPQWPPTAVVDLREPAESKGRPHPLAEVATVHGVALVEGIREDDVEVPDGAHELTVLYQGILQCAGKKLAEVFRIVLETDGPVLVHCAAGKDRTGVVSAMLLSVVGVPDEAIVADYLRTDRNMYRVLQRLNVTPKLPPGVTEDMLGNELLATPTEAIRSVLETFAGYPDGAAGYLRSHGVVLADLDLWRQKFLGS